MHSLGALAHDAQCVTLVTSIARFLVDFPYNLTVREACWKYEWLGQCDRYSNHPHAEPPRAPYPRQDARRRVGCCGVFAVNESDLAANIPTQLLGILVLVLVARLVLLLVL